MAYNLKFTFKQVLAKKVRRPGHGKWKATGNVGTAAAAGSGQQVDLSKVDSVKLPADKWSVVTDVSAMNQLKAKFEVFDTFDNSSLGSVTVTLNSPWDQRQLRYEATADFVLAYAVELEVAGKFGQHAGDAVFTCRASAAAAGAMELNTVSGNRGLFRLEVHEVRPTSPMLTPADRPAFPAGTPPAKLNEAGNDAITPDSPLNVIPNPPVIPIIAPDQVSGYNVARIEFTFYRPKTLAFTDDDARLQWKWVADVGAAAVKFFGRSTGLKVLVYGTNAGEGHFEVSFAGAVVARYRALVQTVRRIPCRANFLDATAPNPVVGGPPIPVRPRGKPVDVVAHIAVATRFLRPLGLELALEIAAVTNWLPNIAPARFSATGKMMLVVGKNQHPIDITANNTLVGAQMAINLLNSGVFASVESQPGPPAQFRLNLAYGGNPVIRIFGNTPLAGMIDMTDMKWRDYNKQKITFDGTMSLHVGAAQHDFVLPEKKNNLTGMRDAIRAMAVGVNAYTLPADGGDYRLLLRPAPVSNVDLFDDPTGANTKICSIVVNNGAVATAVAGIYRIPVALGVTRNVAGAFPAGTALNFRPNVFNFAYVESDAGGGGVLGSAIDRQSNAGANVTDTGTPSSSWINPSGVPPHGASAAVVMLLRPPRQRPGTVAGPTNPFNGLFSMWVATNGPNPSTKYMAYGNTIAHELGHVLHLPHRGVAADPVNDNVNWPPNTNLMHPSNPEKVAQDADILQARAVRLSPLVLASPVV